MEADRIAAVGCLLAAIMTSACAGSPARANGTGAEAISGSGVSYEVNLTTTAVVCIPYVQFQTLVTPEGESVSGLTVCAEFENTCSCEKGEETRQGVANIARSHGILGECLTWTLVKSSFWAYHSGTTCPVPGGWQLLIEPYPGASCGYSIPPQMATDGFPLRFEVVCEWDTTDPPARIVDRLLFQRAH